MAAGPTRTLADGDLVFSQGERGDEAYVIASGKVEIFRSKEGKDTQLAVLTADQYFGEMSLLLDAPRSASARAVGEAELLAIDAETFRRLTVADPMVWDLLTAMGERISVVDAKLEEHEVRQEKRMESLTSIITARQRFY